MDRDQKLLYEEFITALGKQTSAGAEDYTEICFWISMQYWQKLKLMVKGNYLKDEEKAIFFFKYTKPMFTGRIQYFTLLSEALSFAPDAHSEQLLYWENELERLPRYLTRNHYFAGYYDSGSTEQDQKFFLPVKENWVPSDKQFFYDADPEFCSPNDYQARGLLAYRLFNEFVKEKIKKILSHI